MLSRPLSLRSVALHPSGLCTTDQLPAMGEAIVGNDCRLCIDPLNPQAIADAIDFLVGHLAEVERMQKNGCNAVERRYNWDVEERKLLDLYKAWVRDAVV